VTGPGDNQAQRRSRLKVAPWRGIGFAHSPVACQAAVRRLPSDHPVRDSSPLELLLRDVQTDPDLVGYRPEAFMVRFFCGRSGLRELGRRCKAGMIWRRRRIEGSCAAAASRSKHHHDRGAYDEPVSSSSMTHNDQPHTCSPFCRTELAMSQGNRPFVMPEARQTGDSRHRCGPWTVFRPDGWVRLTTWGPDMRPACRRSRRRPAADHREVRWPGEPRSARELTVGEEQAQPAH
jgi:hypothetical protein